MPTISTLTDDFASGYAGKWPGTYANSGAITTANGEATIPISSATYSALYTSPIKYDCRNGEFIVRWKIPGPGAGMREFGIELLLDSSNLIYFFATGYPGTLWAGLREKGGVTYPGSVALPSDTVWVKFSITNSVVTYSYSMNRTDWTVLGTASPTFNMDNLEAHLYAGAWGADGSFACSYGYVNTVPITVVPGEVWNGTRWVAPEVWNGTRWVPGSEVEVFNGTTWIPMGTGTAAVVPRLVRSGRGVNGTSVNIDLSGVTVGKKTLLFVTRNNSATSLSCPVGTLLANDTGGPRRTSVWDMTGQTGAVTITGNTSSLWCYAVVEVESILAAACGYANDATSVAAPVSATVPAGTTKAVVWWTTNNSADWTVPSGVTALEVVTTQNAEPSWLLGWMAAAPGEYTTPTCDRGKAGTTRIETTGLAAVA